jgi:hypothetical protein
VTDLPRNRRGTLDSVCRWYRRQLLDFAGNRCRR